MSEAIQFLRREIARRQAEIEALQSALGVLLGDAAPPSERQQREEGGILTVNGVDVELSAREFKVASALSAAEDCVPAAELAPLCSGNPKYVQTCVWVINKKLKAAGAEIVHFRGQGYRLQNIDEEQ